MASITGSTKINIGCGPTGQISGFDNLDNSPSVLISKIPYLKAVLYRIGLIQEHQYRADWSNVSWCDASKRLPYADESVDKIYSSHFLEHIGKNEAERVLKECYRVLKKDGMMRLIVPDLLWHAERYVSDTKALLKNEELPEDTNPHDVFLKTMYGAYLHRKRKGAEHLYMYDLPSLVALLKMAGFRNIRKCSYREGADRELASFDSRPNESLHLEVNKH